jgi:hypothetical protein
MVKRKSPYPYCRPSHVPSCGSELALRRKCYPAWVKSGKLDAGAATYQIRCMEAIVRTLMRLDAEQRQLSLFGTGT